MAEKTPQVVPRMTWIVIYFPLTDGTEISASADSLNVSAGFSAARDHQRSWLNHEGDVRYHEWVKDEDKPRILEAMKRVQQAARTLYGR